MRKLEAPVRTFRGALENPEEHSDEPEDDAKRQQYQIYKEPDE